MQPSEPSRVPFPADDPRVRRRLSRIDRLIPRLIPRRLKGQGEEARLARRAIRIYLGLDGPAPQEAAEWPSPPAISAYLRLEVPAIEWPTLDEVGRRLDLSSAAVAALLASTRRGWISNQGLTLVRREIAHLLTTCGRVFTAPELVAAVAWRLASDEEEPERTRHAGAVARAATDAEGQILEPRWVLRRRADGQIEIERGSGYSRPTARQ